jgi:hypothetical protein
VSSGCLPENVDISMMKIPTNKHLRSPIIDKWTTSNIKKVCHLNNVGTLHILTSCGGEHNIPTVDTEPTLISRYMCGTGVAMIVWLLDLQLHMQSVHIATDVVCSNLDQGEVYNIM